MRAKRNPITGHVATADVVLTAAAAQSDADQAHATVRDEILALCRDALPRHKVPALIRFVDALDVTASGKLARRDGP